MTRTLVRPAVDADIAWTAFLDRDRAYDGRFVGAVRTTGIYCKPSCPARRPKRENMDFYADGAAARAAGYRPCLRCRPDEAARDEQAVAAALALIEAAETPPGLEALARAVGYAPHHFHRLFRRAVGVTPAAYARKRRSDRLAAALDAEASVTDAIYAAGYAAPSRAYAETEGRLGMTPSVWRDGGRGAAIRYLIAETSLGRLLIAATDKGLCRIAFDEDEGALRRRFPHAAIQPADAAFGALATEVVALVDDPARAAALPLDVAGTAFQAAVWQALRAIPPGQTRSYGQIAEAIGRPGAARAAGGACGSNPVPLVVPCHRVVSGSGGLGGYAHGPERKRALLARERESGGG